MHELGEHELLVIVQGPHGYISSSWYGDYVEVPTWNFIVAHLTAVPELLEHDENFEVLSRLVDHFEQRVASPRPLDATPEVAANARRDSRGTIGLRLVPTRIVEARDERRTKPPGRRESSSARSELALRQRRAAATMKLATTRTRRLSALSR